MKRLFRTFLMTLAVSLGLSGLVQAQTNPPAGAAQIPPVSTPSTVAPSAPIGLPILGSSVNGAPGTILNGGPSWADSQSASCGMGTFYAAVGLQVVKPYFEHNPAVTVSTVNTVVGATQTSNRNSDYTYDFDVTPRVILGWVNENGLGARVGWWLYDHNADTIAVQNALRPGDNGGNFVSIATPHLAGLPSNLLPAGAREIWQLNNSIRFDVWDFEVTQAVALGWVDVIFAGGLRYAHMTQSVRESFRTENSGLANFGTYDASRGFNGIGPTFALNARAPLAANLGLSLYSNARLGALFGRSADAEYLITPAFIAPPGIAPLAITRNNGDRDSLLGFMEGEIGLEWTGQMQNFQPFVRLGLVGSVWHGVGNTENTPTGPAAIPGPLSSTFGFFGYSILVGVNY